MLTSTPKNRSHPCSWQIVEPPALPVLAYQLDRLERSLRSFFASEEELLVELVCGALFDRTPFDLIDAVRTLSVAPHSVPVVVNAIVAASHHVQPNGRVLRDIMFLATACPMVIAGAGWLHRLDQRLINSRGVLAAAIAVEGALVTLVEAPDVAA